MKAISIFDIFKIGVGPSSSHTLGPWRAALKFVDHLPAGVEVDQIKIQLYGSLSKTGIGHATNIAVLLGLLGYDPTEIDTKRIAAIIDQVRNDRKIILNHTAISISFDFEKDIIFERSTHTLHPNTLRFSAFFEEKPVLVHLYASVGGGFIESPDIADQEEAQVSVPYYINSGHELLSHTGQGSCNISEITYKNELAFRSEKEIEVQSKAIIDAFIDSIYEGCTTGGILPGGLKVVRRAKILCDKLLKGQVFSSQKEWLEALKKAPKDFNTVNKWVSCFALAVNEQNAAMGRIVTSPTNGSAGVIPSVLMYYYLFCDYKGEDSINQFLYTAAEIGSLFKKGATISAAVGGCQAEIGVSSAMAAAGLTEVLGGTPAQCLMAAEIAIEHHFGLTCDPVKGLVQIPCIERNAMGAIKAITASNLALEGDPATSKVSLDAAIKTMWDVSLDMNTKYKETSEGGLAINVSVINPSC
jgi:L-serine dehydratase